MEILTDDRMNTPIDESDELYHHGIKGMKWGIRRYQTKDGSLTPAGQKRYNKEMEKLQKEERRLANERATKAKLDKLDNARKRIEDQKAELKKKPGDDEDKPKQKSVSEMTNEEVAAYKQRMQNERDILKFQSEISAMTPKEKTKIEKFTDGIGGKLVKTVWNDVGKNQINKILEKNLGIEKPLDELGKLKKEADIWKQKENISKSKNTIWNNDKNQREYNENRDKKERERAEKEQKAKDAQAAKEANKQREMDAYEEFQRKERESRENPTKRDTSSTYRMKGEDIIDSLYTSGKKKQLLLNGPVQSTELSPYIDKGEKLLYSIYGRDGSFITYFDPMKHSMNQTPDELYHYGIKGMKWGVHRFYNKDGSRTAAGKKRENEAKREKRSSDDSGNFDKKNFIKSITKRDISAIEARHMSDDTVDKIKEFREFRNSEKFKKAVKTVDDYETAKQSYNNKHNEVWRKAVSDIEKKYGKYEDLKRLNDTVGMKNFDKDYKKLLNERLEQHGINKMRENLDKKYKTYVNTRDNLKNDAMVLVDEQLGKYSGEKLKGQGSAIYKGGKVVDRLSVKDVVSDSIIREVKRNYR